MSKNTFSSRLARWVTVAVTLALMGGCKQEEPLPAATRPPVEAPPHPVPAAPVAPEESFALSEVTFRFEDKGSYFAQLNVSYRVRNRGVKRERVYLCVDFIDKDGFFVEKGLFVDQFGLPPGEMDSVVGSPVSVAPDVWKASEVLRFYLQKGRCQVERSELRSNVLVLARSGLPPPPGVASEGKESEVDADDVPVPWFRLEDVRVRQNADGEVWADYRITNLTKGRATSQLCVRIVNDTSCSCRGVDEAESETFNLGFGTSERLDVLLNLKDNENWGRGRYLVIYASLIGCGAPPEDASSNVVILPKPRAIQAPEPLGDEME